MNNNQQIEQGASSIIDTLAEKVAGQMEEANQDKPTAAQIQKKIEQIAQTIQQKWLSNTNSSLSNLSTANATSLILQQARKVNITRKRRQELNEQFHELQGMLLRYLNRFIGIRNVRIENGMVSVYVMDASNMKKSGVYENLTDKTTGELLKEDTSILPNLNDTYVDIDHLYQNNLKRKSKYLMWEIDDTKWAKVWVHNRGSLGEMYLYHYYKGRSQQEPLKYDAYFKHSPARYNMFFYGKTGDATNTEMMINKETQLIHSVTNQQGFTLEDIGLGKSGSLEVYLGAKFGDAYNTYRLKLLLKNLDIMYKNLAADPSSLGQEIQRFEQAITKEAKSEVHQIKSTIIEAIEKEKEALIKSKDFHITVNLG